MVTLHLPGGTQTSEWCVLQGYAFLCCLYEPSGGAKVMPGVGRKQFLTERLCSLVFSSHHSSYNAVPIPCMTVSSKEENPR